MKTIFFIWLFLFVGASFIFVLYHESAHIAIYENYGEHNSSFHMDWKTGTPYITGRCPEYSSECEKMHSQNEILGYHIIPLFVSIWIFFLFWLLYKEEYLERTYTQKYL